MKKIISLFLLILPLVGHANQPIMPDNVVFSQRIFISRCSNINLEAMANPDVMNIAYTNCMARIAGFTDGNAYSEAINNISITKKPWCIPIHYSPIEIFTNVLTYIEQNQSFSINFLSLPSTDSTTAFSLVIRHLKRRYPCRQY